MVSLVSLAALAALAGCGGGGGDDAQPTAPAASQEPPATFIAFSTHFTDFTTWTAFPLGETTPSDGEKAGPRTVYVNRLPKAGSAAFPWAQSWSRQSSPRLRRRPGRSSRW